MKLKLLATTVLLLLATELVFGAASDQVARWKYVQLNSNVALRLDKLIARYTKTRRAYEAIEKMRRNGVPAVVSFSLLYRESDNNMRCSPAQGDSLRYRSIHVPKGRIPGVKPPYTFLQAAEDAYYSPDLDHLDRKDWRSIGPVLWNTETFNGVGYAKHGRPSPYVWSGTNQYQRGKYPSDGRFDPMMVDKQLGTAAIMIRMIQRGIKLPFRH